jgi:hypothetical protein
VRPASYIPILLCASLAYAQTVTARADVRVDGKVEHVRKINGRWWSDDNRQMFPPKIQGNFWIIDHKSQGGHVFNHHRPIDLARAESLHLFMTPETVEQILGEPNETLSGRGEPGFYFYYASQGTCVKVRFMQNGLLGEAKYDRLDGTTALGGDMVASVTQDLSGRSIYEILAAQASQKVAQRSNERRPIRTTSNSTQVVSLPPIEAAKPPARLIAAEAWAKIATGMTRVEVITQVGEPLSTMKIAGSDPPVETLRYAFESEGDATVRLEDGKAVRITPSPVR